MTLGSLKLAAMRVFEDAISVFVGRGKDVKAFTVSVLGTRNEIIAASRRTHRRTQKPFRRVCLSIAANQ